MKTRSIIIALLAAVLIIPAGRAIAAEAKIGYVDLQKALLEVEEGKTAKSSLQVYFEEKQKMLDAESTRLQQAKDDLEKQAMAISPEVYKQKETDLQKQLIEAQKLYYNLQMELKQKEQDAVAPILDKMQVILKDVAEKEGYDLILDKNSSGIVYAPMKYDLTAQLIRLYDERFGKKGAKK